MQQGSKEVNQTKPKRHAPSNLHWRQLLLLSFILMSKCLQKLEDALKAHRWIRLCFKIIPIVFLEVHTDVF